MGAGAFQCLVKCAGNQWICVH